MKEYIMKQHLINNINIVDAKDYYKMFYTEGKILLIGLIPIVHITKDYQIYSKTVGIGKIYYRRYTVEDLLYKKRMKVDSESLAIGEARKIAKQYINNLFISFDEFEKKVEES